MLSLHVLHDQGVPQPGAIDTLPFGELLLQKVTLSVVILHLDLRASIPSGSFCEPLNPLAVQRICLFGNAFHHVELKGTDLIDAE